MTDAPTAPASKSSGSATFSATRRRLPAAQKSNRGAPAYSRFVNRPIGGYLATAAYLLHRTPNQVTAISSVFTFAGIAAIALLRPGFWLGVAITAALLLGYALDSADGQLARLRGGGSYSGEWLDHVIDAAKVASLHLAVLVACYRYFPVGRGYLLVPLAFQVVAVVTFFGVILNDQLRRRVRAGGHAVHELETPAESPSLLRSLAVTPVDYGLLCLVFLTFGLVEVFPVVYAVMLAANVGYLGIGLVKWFRDIGRLDALGREAA